LITFQENAKFLYTCGSHFAQQLKGNSQVLCYSYEFKCAGGTVLQSCCLVLGTMQAVLIYGLQAASLLSCFFELVL